MKRKFALALACVFSLSMVLTACGDADNSTSQNPATQDPNEQNSVSSATENILDDHTVKVAVLDNMWTDRSGDAMKVCGEYLEANFNCEFQYVTLTDTSAQSVITATEDAITMGCEIIITTVAEGIEQSSATCQEAGVAFAMINANPRTEDQSILESYDSYVATVCPPLDTYSAGYQAAEELIAEGNDNFAIVTFTKGLLTSVDEQVAGFTDACEELGANIIYSLEEMPGESMITAVSTMLETYGDQIEYIAAFGGGTNFVVPSLTAQGLTIPLLVPSVPTDYEAYFNSGILDYVQAYSDDALTIAFALCVNYLNGAQVSGMPENKTIETCNVVLRNLDEVTLYDELSTGIDGADPTFNAEEIRSMIVAYTPDASAEDVMALAQSVDLQGIQSRHGT